MFYPCSLKWTAVCQPHSFDFPIGQGAATLLLELPLEFPWCRWGSKVWHLSLPGHLKYMIVMYIYVTFMQSIHDIMIITMCEKSAVPSFLSSSSCPFPCLPLSDCLSPRSAQCIQGADSGKPCTSKPKRSAKWSPRRGPSWLSEIEPWGLEA